MYEYLKKPQVSYTGNKSSAASEKKSSFSKPTVSYSGNRETESLLSTLKGMAQVNAQAAAQSSKTTYDRDVLQFRGLNTREGIDDNELEDMLNLSSNNMPYISTRDRREQEEVLSGNPNGLFSNGIALAWVDGTDFVYDGVVVGTVEDSFKTMCNMNGNIVILPDCKYYDYINEVFGSFDAPDNLLYITEWNNRLWAVADDDSYIYATKQGQFDDWETMEDVSTDAYFVDTGGNTNFTGIATYNNHVTAFKSDQFFEIYGNIPENFQVITGTKDGLENNEALCEVDSQLYFLSNDGPMVYTGGVPTSIGLELPEDIETGTFGRDKNKLYFSANDGTTDVLYVYDPRYGYWHKEDFTKVVRFENHLGQLYGLCDDGALYKLGRVTDGTEGVLSWYLETKQYYDATFMKKEYHALNLLLKIDPDGYVSVKIELDNGDEINYGTFTSTTYEDMEINIPINQKKCNRFKLILEGEGEMVLKHVQRQFSIGSELPAEGGGL
ncbi:MAG: hypothetical protein ACQ5SW_08405 [Sphaerochaetaceae bacterium]